MACGPKCLKCPGNPKEIMHFPMDVLRCPTFRVPSLYLNGMENAIFLKTGASRAFSQGGVNIDIVYAF